MQIRLCDSILLVHHSTHSKTNSICFFKHTANTLPYTATPCNAGKRLPLKDPCKRDFYAWQHTATHCNTLQHTATHCNTLQHKKSFTAKASVQARLLRPRTHCNTLQHTATQEISHRWSIQASETPTPWHTNLMAGSIHLWYSAGMLYVCGAVSCSELQRVAVCRRAHSPWSTPPDAVCVWCSELQWVAACCSVL